MNRPLLWVAGSYAVGIALAARFHVPSWMLVALATLALILSVLAYRMRWRQATNLALLAAFLLAGGIYYEARRPIVRDDPLSRELATRRGEIVAVEGSILQTSLFRPGIDRSSFIVAAEKIEDEQGSRRVSGKAHVRWYSPDVDLRIGNIVSFSAEVMPFPGHLNPGLTGFRDLLHRRRIHTALAIFGPHKVQKVGFTKPGGVDRLVEATRRKIHSTFYRTLPEEHAGFLSAVWLGERNMLPRNTKKTFVESGIYHVTAVSGLHVFIVYFMIAMILGIRAPARKKRIVTAIALIVLYALVAAANPPVVRAAIMLIVLLAAGLFNREPDRLSTLCLAGLVMLLWDPALLFLRSFQLSFLAVTAIALFAPMLENAFLRVIPLLKRDPIQRLSAAPPPLLTIGGLSRPWALLLPSASYVLAIAFFTLPATVQSFNIFAPVAIVANPIIIPLMGLVLGLAALASVSGFVSIEIARLFSATNRILIAIIFRAADFFSWVPWGHFRIRSPSMVSVVCFYAAMTLILFHKHLRLRKVVLIPVTASLFIFSALGYVFVITPPELEVVFLDVGQGDCIFVQVPDGGAIVIDGGPLQPRYDIGEHIIAPFLWKRGVRTLDIVLISHPQNDHMGGLPYVLEHFRVERLITNDRQSENLLYQRIMTIAEEEGIPVQRLAKGSRIVAGGRFQVLTLHPPEQAQELTGLTINEASLVLKMSYGTMDFLFTGDINARIERELCEEYDDLESEVLKVPHHGSKYSSSNEFLRTVKPQIAVVQVGRNNPHGHPTAEALGRYDAVGCHVFRTDLDGGVTVTSDGTRFWYRTEADSLPQDLLAETEFVEMWYSL